MALRSVTTVALLADQAAMNAVLQTILGGEFSSAMESQLGADFVTLSHYYCTTWMADAQITTLKSTATVGTTVSVRGVDDASPKDVFRRLGLKRIGHEILGSAPNGDV